MHGVREIRARELTSSEKEQVLYVLTETNRLQPQHAGCTYNLLFSLLTQSLLWVEDSLTGERLDASSIELDFVPDRGMVLRVSGRARIVAGAFPANPFVGPKKVLVPPGA